MTPAELLQIKALIKDAVAAAEQRVQDELAGLRHNDTRHDTDLRKHSGTHKDLAASVRQSLSEVKEATNNDLLRATTVVGTELGEQLAAFRVEMKEEIAKAAKNAAMAATAAGAARGATTDLAVAQIGRKEDEKRKARWQAIAAFVGFALATAITHLLK